MSRSASPTLVGGFVVGAFALAVVGLVLFGSGRLFQQSMTCVLYFPESVNGLVEGAPVKLQGVPVGQVRDIRLDLDLRQDRSQIAVLIDLDETLISRRSAQTVNVRETAAIREAVKSGLRGRLASQSFLTGLLFVELSFAPDTPIRRVENYYPYPEIPTLPSRTQEIQNMAAEAVERISKIKFEELVDSFTNMANSVANLADDPSIRKAADSLAEAATQLESLIVRIEGEVDPLSSSLQQTSAEANDTLVKLRDTLREVDAMVKAGSPLRYQVTEALSEITRAARSVRVLADALEQAPQSVLTGRSPEERLP